MTATNVVSRPYFHGKRTHRKRTHDQRTHGKQIRHPRHNRLQLAGFGLAACLGLTPVATAIEGSTLAASTLIASCQAYASHVTDTRDHNVNATLCQAYLQGFLAATNDIVREENRPSEFTLRVLRTRGMRLTEHQQKLLYSTYCFPAHETLQTFAANITLLQDSMPRDAAAVDAVEQTLEQHYRCDRRE